MSGADNEKEGGGGKPVWLPARRLDTAARAWVDTRPPPRRSRRALFRAPVGEIHRRAVIARRTVQFVRAAVHAIVRLSVYAVVRLGSLPFRLCFRTLDACGCAFDAQVSDDFRRLPPCWVVVFFALLASSSPTHETALCSFAAPAEIAATSAEKIAEKAKADEKIAQLEARVAELKRSALYAEGRVDGDGGTFHLKPHVVGAEDTHVVATEPSNDVSEQATSVWRRPSVEKTSASDSKEKLEEPANVFLPTEAQKWKPVEVFPRSPGTINHTDIRRYTAPVKDWGKGGDGDGIEDALEGLDPKTTPLVVTFANKDYAQFLVNWIVHARMSGIERSAAIVIGAMDERVLKVARRWNLRAFSMEHTIHSFGWGAQIGVINDLITEFKFSVLMCDVDMVWLKDPFPWINAVPARANADVLLSSDCASCMQDEADGKCIFAPFNIGIMYWRATEMASELGKTWADQVKKGGRMDYMEEQNVLNDVIRGENWVRLMPAAPVPGTVAKQRAFVVYSRQKFGNVSVGQMPVANFAHGHTYFTTKQPQRLSVDVYAVHATFQFGPKRQGQFMGKRQRFREEGLWVLDPVKHYEEGKFLTWSEELPLQFRDEDSPEKGDLNFHLRVVKHHLKAMRNGMLLAKKLGRILIIPRLTCFCDRHWTPILPECAMKDSDLVPPFHCPLDHLFNPVTFWRGAAQLGVDIREIGFLDDVRVPDRVKQDVARVKVGSFYVPAPDARGNIVHPNAAPPPDAEILPDSNDDEIAERLRPLEDRTVIMISDMAGALCGLKSSEENDHAEHVMYNGDRKNRNPLRGGILNGFDWCCWNPLKTEKPPGYQPTAMPYRMPEPLDSQRCSSEPRLVAANTFSEKERNLTSV